MCIELGNFDTEPPKNREIVFYANSSFARGKKCD